MSLPLCQGAEANLSVGIGEQADQLTHCKENPIYVIMFWELRGLSPNFYIYVSVSDLYIPRIGPHISLQQNRQTDSGNIYKSLADI
jgi:hypothetical protein